MLEDLPVEGKIETYFLTKITTWIFFVYINYIIILDRNRLEYYTSAFASPYNCKNLYVSDKKEITFTTVIN